MYVSETTLEPLRMTLVTEAASARKSVAFSDVIAMFPRIAFLTRKRPPAEGNANADGSTLIKEVQKGSDPDV